MSGAILALNAGSSSVKFGLFCLGGDHRLDLMARGTLEDAGTSPGFVARGLGGEELARRSWTGETAHADLLQGLLDWIGQHLGDATLEAVGHRVVHGGDRFAEPAALDDATLAAIDGLTPLAPLHQPRCLEPVRALRRLRPDLPQVACFDTAFHRTLKPPVNRYALPRRYEAAGVRQYGFHGLSYEYIAGRLAEIDPALPGRRTIVAHLGSGASLCALEDGRSVDTTMGFSVLDGLVMGTRPGALDPGVVLYLQRHHGLDLDAIEHLLYHESGLLGVSGISSDMRELWQSDAPEAREAIELFAFRVGREAAALAGTLGGLDAFVFTGGVGEHDAGIRAAVAERLAWLGAKLDPEANDRAERRIAAPDSNVALFVIPTDEERMIAAHTAGVLGQQ